MLRWFALCLVSAVFVACSTPSKPLSEMLPASIDGWTRTEASPLNESSVPALVKQQGLKRAVAASYSGPAEVTVRVYEMNVSTSAFELIQKWKQQDGFAVYSGPYFIVAGAESGRQASSLLEALRKHLQ
jgi:hypothetical protein